MSNRGALRARTNRERGRKAPSPENSLFFPPTIETAPSHLKTIALVEPPVTFGVDVTEALRALEPKSKEGLRLRLYATLVALDIFCVVFGFTIANRVRFDDPLATPGWSYAAAIIPLFVALAFSTGAYGLEALEKPGTGIRKTLRALTLTVFALLLALFLSKSSAEFSRLTFALGIAISVTAIVISRRSFGRVAGRLSNGIFLNELLLVDGKPVRAAGRQQVFQADRLGFSSHANDPQTLEQLGKLIDGYDRVIVSASKESRLKWREVLKGCGVDIEILAPELDRLGALNFRRSELGSAILVAPGPLNAHERFLKRTFDIVVGTALLFLLAPLMLAIAVAIRLTSDGPALFHQQRIGRANKQFEMLKFRTMYSHCCDANGYCSTKRHDDRVTPLGHLLRRTSMDELPQLINVIRGDMSLVGPRPHAVASTAGDALFWNVDDRYWQRCSVRPGITGLAQVRGYRGATATSEDVLNRVSSDLEYLSRWSVWTDIKIMVRTTKVLLHQNAF